MLTVHAGQRLGGFRALHGVTGGPWVQGGCWDLSDRFEEMRTPVVRLHDCPYSDPGTVDVHCIFPDFAADPENPDSYRFERTDEHLDPLIRRGIQVIYRLGESIEHSKKKYYVNPPADSRKWARVCANIVRHYNHGWAEGFQWNIGRWEIWNEPDVNPKCWTGTAEEYLDLYQNAALAIKAVDRNLMVGGPALGHKWDLFVQFLQYCRHHSLPLDFVSWHAYGDMPRKLMDRIEYGHACLKEHGFQDIETHLTEWNYVTSFTLEPMVAREVYARTIGVEGAAFTGAMLAFLQSTELDLACYCSAVGGIGRLCMFDRYCAPNTSFYAFKAFGEVVSRGTRVAVTGNDIESGLGIVAGVNPDAGEAAVLVSNFQNADRRHEVSLEGLPIASPIHCREYVIDGARQLAKDREQILSGNSFCLVLDLPAPSARLLCFSTQQKSEPNN